MSSSSEVYGPPPIPNTPSKGINSMLDTRCGKPQSNPVKAAVVFAICYIFQAITTVYNTIHSDKTTPSHTMWMVSSGVVSVGLILAIVLGYWVLMASAFIVHNILYIASWVFALFGVGIGVAGAVFFDKEAAPVADAPKSE